MTVEIRHRFTNDILFTYDGVNLSRADLSLVNLSRANLFRANLSRANLSRANLSRANLSRADLYGANLSRADLSGADLSRTNLSGADLSRTNLSGVDLSGANLYEANLYGANLSGADLSGTNLYEANLYGATLYGAKVHDFVLVGARPFFTVGPIGSESRTVFAWLTEAGLRIQTNCFFGTRDEFTEQLAKTHGDNKHAQEYTAALVLIDMHAKLWTPA